MFISASTLFLVILTINIILSLVGIALSALNDCFKDSCYDLIFSFSITLSAILLVEHIIKQSFIGNIVWYVILVIQSIIILISMSKMIILLYKNSKYYTPKDKKQPKKTYYIDIHGNK